MMAKQYQYIVKRPFKYGRRKLKVGQVWNPNGGKFDKQIIESDHYVRMEEVQPAPKKRRVRSKADG